MDLFIDDTGRTVADLHTVADCDAALTWLTDAIVSIRNQPTTPASRKALVFRRLAVQRINEHRARLRRDADDQRLIRVIERLNPDVVAEARRIAA